jgi:hypothetical protein
MAGTGHFLYSSQHLGVQSAMGIRSHRYVSACITICLETAI